MVSCLRVAACLTSVVLGLPAASSAVPDEADSAFVEERLAEIEQLRSALRFADAAEVVGELLNSDVVRSNADDLLVSRLRQMERELIALQAGVDEAARLKERGEFLEAAAAARDVLALELLHYGDAHPSVVECRSWCESIENEFAAERRQWRDFEAAVRQGLERGDMEQVVGASVAQLQIKRRLYGKPHTEVARALLKLAMYEEEDGRAETALKRYDEAIAMLAEVLGEENWQVAEARFDQSTAAAMSRLPRARQLELVAIQDRAVRDVPRGNPELLPPHIAQMNADLERVEVLLGRNNRYSVVILMNLGDLLLWQGRDADAESAYQQGVDLLAEAADKSHPNFSALLSRLSVARSNLADHESACGFAQQAADLTARTVGLWNEKYLVELRNLGYALYGGGRHAQSLAVHEQLLVLHRAIRGDEHPETGRILADLANDYLNDQQPELAHQYAIESMERIRELDGTSDPRFLRALNLLGMIEDNLGRPDAARQHYEELVERAREAFGPHHPEYAVYASALAAHHQLHGDHAAAADMLEEVLEIERAQLAESYRAQTQRQQLKLSSERRGRLFAYVTCCVELGERALSVYEHVLEWKGAVSRQQAVAHGAVDVPAARALWQDRAETASRLSQLLYDANSSEADRVAVAIDCIRRLGEMERQLARYAEPDAVESGVSAESLAAAIPPEAVLVDLYSYNHFTPRRTEQALDFQLELRLLAFILRPGAELKMVELGPVAVIQEASDEWRLDLQSRRGKVDEEHLAASPQGRLRSLVWEPIVPHLGEAELVLICPDGPINSIPVAALPGENAGHYLIEERAFVTIPYVAWLAEEAAAAEAADAPASLLLVGDVDFGGDPAPLQIASRMASTEFVPLPGTAREIAAISELHRDAFPGGGLATSSGADASETRFREIAPARRFLHLATHGFCLQESANAASDAVDINDRSKVVDYAREYTPELLSGIVLAGVNAPAERGGANRDDGVLTALELSTLDLRNVELMVLSACETGLGHESTGEGMLGLQRSMQIAGVRTSVTSLWRVDDHATQVLMTEFYTNLWGRQLSRVESLRQAQLTLLRQYDPARRTLQSRGASFVDGEDEETGTVPPYYWAAFGLSGEWR